jgi:ribosomal protein S18 acetylase RimI-like enzyme
MEITYTDNIDKVKATALEGFFEDWPNPPDPSRHLKILAASYKVWLAMDGEKCVGFINALSDGILHAYIPLLEVLPVYQGLGIGTELIRRMEQSLEKVYAIDLVCDEHLTGYYQRLGFTQIIGMAKRNHEFQDGSGGEQD